MRKVSLCPRHVCGLPFLVVELQGGNFLSTISIQNLATEPSRESY